MKFSILIPVYNVEDYIKKCIDSVIEQEFNDYEIILVDDGSTDKSGEICDAYEQCYPNRVKVIHKRNEGLMLARRDAIKEAKGEYFVFVDSDDYISDNFLETINKEIKDTNADIIMFNYFKFYNMDYENVERQCFPVEDGYIFTDDNKQNLFEMFVLTHAFCNMWSKVVKRTVVDIEADYSRYSASKCEDVIQTFPLFENAKKIVCIDKALYYYRKSSYGMTSNTRLSDIDDYLKCTKRSIEYIKIWNMSEEIYNKYVAWQMVFYYNILRNLEKVHNRKTLVQAYKKLRDDDTYMYHIVEQSRCEFIHKRMKIRMKIMKFILVHKLWNIGWIFVRI